MECLYDIESGVIENNSLSESMKLELEKVSKVLYNGTKRPSYVPFDYITLIQKEK